MNKKSLQYLVLLAFFLWIMKYTTTKLIAMENRKAYNITCGQAVFYYDFVFPDFKEKINLKEKET